jgi:hypothetical protein
VNRREILFVYNYCENEKVLRRVLMKMLNDSTNNAQSEIPPVLQTNSNQVSKPEAIVRPQRRREISQERPINNDQDDVELGDKNHKESVKENSKKLFPRRSIYRDSKKGSRDVSNKKFYQDFLES